MCCEHKIFSKCLLKEVSCLVVSKISENSSYKPVNVSKLNIPKNINLADHTFFKSGQVDLLLGAEVFFSLLCVGQLTIGNNAAVVQKNRLDG